MTDLSTHGSAELETAAFPMPRACPMHPPARYADLRAEGAPKQVLLESGRVAWLVSRYEHARQILLDPRASSDRAKPGYPLTSKEIQELPPEVLEKMLKEMNVSLAGMDAPKHTQMRRELIPDFTVKRMHSLRKRIQEITDEHIDAMLAAQGPVDLVDGLALPVPSLVICELIGAPYEDHEYFQERTLTSVSRKYTVEQQMAAMHDVLNYVDTLVTRKEAAPGEDILGRYIKRHQDAGDYDHDELVSLTRLMLLAGHETTANMISLGVVGLLENPDQLAKIKADPSLTGGAVEEVLRYFSITDQLTARAATEDIELDGVLIRKGDGIMVLNAAANWDGDVFPEPDKLDVTRENARSHVAFGHGAHQCLGQNLSRLELEIVFNTLFERIPTLRLAVPAAELEYKDGGVFGIHEVPVTW